MPTSTTTHTFCLFPRHSGTATATATATASPCHSTLAAKWTVDIQSGTDDSILELAIWCNNENDTPTVWTRSVTKHDIESCHTEYGVASTLQAYTRKLQAIFAGSETDRRGNPCFEYTPNGPLTWYADLSAQDPMDEDEHEHEHEVDSSRALNKAALGSWTLQALPHKDTARVLRRWTTALLHGRMRNLAEIATVRKREETHMRELQHAQEIARHMKDAHAEYEEMIMFQFAQVLNAKKMKIRLLQRHLAKLEKVRKEHVEEADQAAVIVNQEPGRRDIGISTSSAPPGEPTTTALSSNGVTQFRKRNLQNDDDDDDDVMHLDHDTHHTAPSNHNNAEPSDNHNVAPEIASPLVIPNPSADDHSPIISGGANRVPFVPIMSRRKTPAISHGTAKGKRREKTPPMATNKKLRRTRSRQTDDNDALD
ncbi:hypothetical protein SeMB42_g06819 [Synchytrium endobioticum]|uniref:Uncharacterized protein n=1 Tax=Synchytrium endobioticum TaxID=286115 RepID=A0A507CEU4_9FUNG|nr:hypothetical protein SeMB42_g06819 [Synchytrium endobioticum]